MRKERSDAIIFYAKRCIDTLRHVLFEPSAFVVGERHRRRISFLSGFLLVYFIQTYVGALITSRYGEDYIWVFLFIAGTLALITYFVSRTRYYRSAIILTLIVPVIPTFVLLVTGENIIYPFRAFLWLALPLVFSSLIMSTLWVIIVAVCYVVITVFVVLMADLSLYIISEFIPFLFIITIVVLSIAYIQQKDQAEIKKQLDERNRIQLELVAQQELIERILRSMPEAVVVVDHNNKIVLANQAFCEKFTNYKHRIDGIRLDDVICSESARSSLSAINSNKEKQSLVEFRQANDEDTRIFLARNLAIGNEQVLIMIIDVTEDRERREKLYLADRLASVGKMAAGIAHELNNPLTSVIGFSQLLADNKDLPDNIKDDLKAIYSEARRAANVVSNMLTFARKHDAQKTPIRVNEVLEDVLKLRAYEHKVSNIKVNTSFDSDLGVVMADYFQLQQVFLNIILNAEFAILDAHNGGVLTIAIRQVNANVAITFADNGPGIPEKSLNRIFDPFFTTKDIGKGTGLGLSICYGIIENHNGKIYAGNLDGKGAIFTVELPVLTV